MSIEFQKEQRQLTAGERQQINDIKVLAQDLYDRIDMLPPSNARTIAQVKLQECVMWSEKTITRSL